MLQNPHTAICTIVIYYYLVVTGHCCESMTHRLTAVGVVTLPSMSRNLIEFCSVTSLCEGQQMQQTAFTEDG